MEETQVIIVGAGPAGLALGAALAKHRIHSVILEKEKEITTDPRGVYLTGDALRILYDLGIGHEMKDIAHEVNKVHYHKSSFSTKPFYSLSLGSTNVFKQSLPDGVLQIQPRLENALRQEIQRSQWCTLRTGCTVVSRSNDDPPTLEYYDEHGARGHIRGQWLVGADGKMGVVRKRFLEPTAGVRQEEGVYSYNGTWVAANFKISVPSPQTHPEFPLWNLGYSLEDVYDLFWPKGWHFCCPPGKATATGRFGPHSERLWRYEFCVDNCTNSPDLDAEALLWEHITPMITREADDNGRRFPGPVQYPRDCIEILRCRPFRFVHKVVNRWFDKRTILIGDAAHVFPPFAGQGIGSGVRDAHQLAWRLALLVRSALPNEAQATLSESILGAWALERRKSVDDAAFFSKLNGYLCNNQPPFWVLQLLGLLPFLKSVPFLSRLSDLQAFKEQQGFRNVQGGFFLKRYNGGARLAQIYVESSSKQPLLSDRLLHRSDSLFTLLVISTGDNHGQMYWDAKAAITAAGMNPAILSADSIVLFTPRAGGSTTLQLDDGHKDKLEVFSPVLRSQPPDTPTSNHDESIYVDRLGRATKFAILRPDFFVYSCAKNLIELGNCLVLLKEHVGNT